VRVGGNGAWPEGGCAMLVSALGSSSCVVEELDVADSRLSPSECRALLPALTQVLSLDLSGTSIGLIQDGESPADTALAQLLLSPLAAQLRRLCLRTLRIGAMDGGAGVTLLCDALPRMVELRELDLRVNQLRVPDAEALVRAAAGAQDLRVDLRDNPVPSSAIADLPFGWQLGISADGGVAHVRSRR
jgi:hypothetical protein